MADIDKNREFLTRLWCLENEDRPAFLIGYLGPRVRGGRPVRSALFSTEGEGTVRDRLLDPAKFLEAQLIEINDQMAYQGDFAPCLCPAFGVINIPAAFGCEVVWWEDNFPSVRPLPLAHPAAVRDIPRPTISSGEMGRILKTTRFFIEKTAGRIPIRLTDIQGPLDSAALIMGHTEFFTAIRTHPWEVHHLLQMITDFTIACARAQQEEKGRGVVWARSAFAGSQRYPLVWSGEPAANPESLAATIRGGLSAGLSGLPFWSNDIGGYRGMPSAELYVRWAQFGLFCSHSRMHGDSPREPWHFGEEVLSIVRRYALLRYELFPYIYSAAFEAGLKGLPVIRALPLAFPDDPNVFDKDSQYMFGPGILVAPVIEPGGKHSLYLPEGRWFDYWTGAEFEGPKNLKIEVPLDTLPLYIRGGAIIPKMQRARRIPEERIDPLIVEVWPHGSSTYYLYEDEGVTEFRCKQRRDGLDFEWSGPLPRRVIFHFKMINKPRPPCLLPPGEEDI